jgi:hypothetical protein
MAHPGGDGSGDDCATADGTRKAATRRRRKRMIELPGMGIVKCEALRRSVGVRECVWSMVGRWKTKRRLLG